MSAPGGICPICRRALGPPIDPTNFPGWRRCLHCHADVHPEDDLFAPDPPDVLFWGRFERFELRRAR